MNSVEAKCPRCGITRMIPFKKRFGRGYCSLDCAYKHRVIHHPRQVTCLSCEKVFTSKRECKYCSSTCRSAGYVGFKHSQKTCELMKAAWTEERRSAASIPTVLKQCQVCHNDFKTASRGKGSHKIICSEKCRRTGLILNNHMKEPELRLRMSEIARNRPEELNKKADWFHDPVKFDQIRKCNPALNIKVLLLDELKKLGVLIYVSGHAYYPYLQELIQRGRIQSRAKE